MFYPKIIFFHPLGKDMARDIISWRFEDSLSESSRFEIKLQGRIKWQSSLFELGLGDRFKCQIYFGESWGGTAPIPGYATETPTYTIDDFEMDFGSDTVILTAKSIPNIASLTTIRNSTYDSAERALFAIASRASMSVKGATPDVWNTIIQKKESDLELLERMADEYDLVLKIEDRNVSLIPYTVLESSESVFTLDTEDVDKTETFFNIKDYNIYRGVVLSWEIEVQPNNWNVPVNSSGNANLNVNTSVSIPNINLSGNASISSRNASGTISGTTSDGKSVSGSCYVNIPGDYLNVSVSGSANGSGSGSSSGSISTSGNASVPREKQKQEVRLSVVDDNVAGGSRWFRYDLTEIPANNSVANSKGLLLIQRKNRKRLTGTIRMTEGDARCRSGLPIRLKGSGWGWPLDASGGTGNRYLIESTVHSFDLNNGWQTQIKVFKCYNQVIP